MNLCLPGSNLWYLLERKKKTGRESSWKSSGGVGKSFTRHLPQKRIYLDDKYLEFQQFIRPSSTKVNNNKYLYPRKSTNTYSFDKIDFCFLNGFSWHECKWHHFWHFCTLCILKPTYWAHVQGGIKRKYRGKKHKCPSVKKQMRVL